MTDFSKLKDFDPSMMNDPNYRKLAEQAYKIKNSADEVQRDQQSKQPVQQNVNNDSNTAQKTQQFIRPNFVIPDADNPMDFSINDFINVSKFDNNSPVAKMNVQGIDQSKPIASTWFDRDFMKRYFATKTHFKVKVFKESRYKEYRFRSINEDTVRKLMTMAEDIKNFYPLMIIEGNEQDTIEGDKEKVLLRDGKSYKNVSELEIDYRHEVAFHCLGIDNDEYSTLEQWSDPNWTVLDIFGINDIVEGILERALKGTTYFRIASNQL